MKFLIFLILIFMNVIAFSADIAMSADVFEKRRQEMVEKDIKARGIKDQRVLDAMLTVPRHLFVDENQRNKSYNDHPLPIGEGQTISQPYVVALMTEAVGLKGGERVLEIGTGSGYQAAILSVIVKEVFPLRSNMACMRLLKKDYRSLATRTSR